MRAQRRPCRAVTLCGCRRACGLPLFFGNAVLLPYASVPCDVVTMQSGGRGRGRNREGPPRSGQGGRRCCSFGPGAVDGLGSRVPPQQREGGPGSWCARHYSAGGQWGGVRDSHTGTHKPRRAPDVRKDVGRGGAMAVAQEEGRRGHVLLRPSAWVPVLRPFMVLRALNRRTSPKSRVPPSFSDAQSMTQGPGDRCCIGPSRGVMRVGVREAVGHSEVDSTAAGGCRTYDNALAMDCSPCWYVVEGSAEGSPEPDRQWEPRRGCGRRAAICEGHCGDWQKRGGGRRGLKWANHGPCDGALWGRSRENSGERTSDRANCCSGCPRGGGGGGAAVLWIRPRAS